MSMREDEYLKLARMTGHFPFDKPMVCSLFFTDGHEQLKMSITVNIVSYR